MMILPTAIPIAMTKELASMVPTGSRVVLAAPTKMNAIIVRPHWLPGISGMLPLTTVATSWVEATKAT